MLCEKTSSKLGSVETNEKKAFHDLFHRPKDTTVRRKLRARSLITPTNAQEMHNKHDGPDGEHGANSGNSTMFQI